FLCLVRGLMSEGLVISAQTDPTRPARQSRRVRRPGSPLLIQLGYRSRTLCGLRPRPSAAELIRFPSPRWPTVKMVRDAGAQRVIVKNRLRISTSASSWRLLDRRDAPQSSCRPPDLAIAARAAL